MRYSPKVAEKPGGRLRAGFSDRSPAPGETGRRKVLCVFGTRPEAIKMAPVVLALRRRPELETRVAVTAQHRELLDQVLEHFGLRPDFDLDVMTPEQTLTEVTVRSLRGLEEVLAGENPDLVLVHGDTTTTLAAALAAFYRRLPLGHVEAGLRTGRKYAPYPEEMNRKLTDALSDYLFAPTPRAAENLRREGLPEEGIFVTGNTVVDALLLTVDPGWRFRTPGVEEVLSRPGRVVVAEIHRRESWGKPIRDMMWALRDSVESFSDTFLLFSVHPNPEVASPAREILGPSKRVKLLAPLSYPDWVNLMARSHLVVTDSGGLQEETPTLGKPLVLLREVTERPEALEAGTVILAGTSYRGVREAVTSLLADEALYWRMTHKPNPFGDGRAAERIVNFILWRWGREVAPAPFPGL